MNRGQTMIKDGFEVCLYPLDYINITADPYASNHTIQGVSNSGLWDNGWYIERKRPLYAPFTMKLVYNGSDGHTQLWSSVEPVWIPQFNYPVRVSFAVTHSEILYYTSIGTVIHQGTHFYDTGEYGYAFGDHVHFILSTIERENMFPTGLNTSSGMRIWYSPDAPTNIATFFYISGDETIVNDRGLNWILGDGHAEANKTAFITSYINNKRRKKHVKIFT